MFSGYWPGLLYILLWEIPDLGHMTETGVNTLGNGAAICEETWIRRLVKVIVFFVGRWLGSFGRLFACDAVLLQGLHMQHQQQITSATCPLVGQKRIHSAGLQTWQVWAQRGEWVELQPDLPRDKGAKPWQTWLEEIQGIWIREVLLERGQGCQRCLAIWQSQRAEAGQRTAIAICLT